MGCQVSKAKRAKKGQKSALVVTDTNVVKDSENVKSTEASSRSASGSGSSKKVSKSSKKASRTEEIIESISKRTEKEPEDLQPPRKEESILDDSVFMNPNVGVETAKLVRARSPERDVERTQSDERERSPPPPQPPNVIVNEIMQQAAQAEELDRRRQKERAERRKALKKAQMKRQRLYSEEDTLYELPMNAKMPEIDYHNDELANGLIT